MDVISGMFIGASVGLVVALPAIYAEVFREVKNLPILVDVHACWGKTCTDNEVFVLSFFVHMLISMAFGGIYMALYFLGIVQAFSFFSIIAYGVFFYLFVGGILLPLLRMGFFGLREGRFIWLELLVSTALFVIGYWAAFQLFPVFLPF